MKGLNRGTRIYILVTIGAALAIVSILAPSWSFTLSTEFLALALIGAIVAPHAVHLGMRVEMSISHPFILATMILIGEPEAVFVSAVCIASLCLFRKPRMALYRMLFNIASFIVTTYLTCETYLASGGGGQGVGSHALILPLSLATLVFYLANTYSITGVVALSNRLNLFKVWGDNFLWSAPSFLAGGSLALGMAYFLDQFGVYSFILSLPFCVLIYYSYKLYLDKLEEKRQHLQDIEQMNAELEIKVRERTQELQIVNEKLHQSNRELQRVNSMKSEFLANMSHELRTPLNAIIGFSELLLDESFGTLNDGQRDYATDILSSGRHLLELINDILDLSKIEAGKMQLSREWFTLGPTFEEAMALLRVDAGRKEIDMECQIEDPALEVHADRNKIKQVLYNLLSNAVKFTPRCGKVALRAFREDGRLCVMVSDTGIGIRPEEQTRIFQAFTQVDGSYARQYQGTGLGLALVKKFVEMHGGWVSVESQFGVGSTFSLSIPDLEAPRREALDTPWQPSSALQPGSHEACRLPWGADARDITPVAEAASNGAPNASGMTHSEEEANLIMVVEDNPSSMRLVSDLLKAHGYQVDERRTGEDALEALNTVHPRLILMDVQLPGMDGLQVTRVLSRNPKMRRIPIVALTAHAMKGDEIHAREAGCAGFISKPIETARFPEQIASYLRNGAGAANR